MESQTVELGARFNSDFEEYIQDFLGMPLSNTDQCIMDSQSLYEAPCGKCVMGGDEHEEQKEILESLLKKFQDKTDAREKVYRRHIRKWEGKGLREAGQLFAKAKISLISLDDIFLFCDRNYKIAKPDVIEEAFSVLKRRLKFYRSLLDEALRVSTHYHYLPEWGSGCACEE